jgi:hypothetical protein
LWAGIRDSVRLHHIQADLMMAPQTAQVRYEIRRELRAAPPQSWSLDECRKMAELLESFAAERLVSAARDDGCEVIPLNRKRRKQN